MMVTNPDGVACCAVTEGVNVDKITGNASKTRQVATELQWVREAQNEESLCPTVIMVVLESIYDKRYEQMRDIYR